MQNPGLSTQHEEPESQQQRLTESPQQDEQQASPVAPSSEGSAAGKPEEKKRRRRVPPVSEKELESRPSIWPIVLAFSLSVVLVGVVFHPIILGVGVLLVIITALGWALERRS